MKVIYKSAQYVKAQRRKVSKPVYIQYSKFQQGNNSYKLDDLMNLILCSFTETHTGIQKFNSISNHVGEKFRKL